MITPTCVDDVSIEYAGIEVRKQLGLTLRDVEAMTYISKGTICKWETGKSIPSLQQLAIVAKCYGVNWSELIRVI